MTPTPEQVAAWAREAGIPNVVQATNPSAFERFAALACAWQAEQDAKRAEGFEQNRDWVDGSLWGNIRNDVAAAIRANAPKGTM